MQESYNDERKIDEFKPKMRTLERLGLLEIDVGNTVVLAKLDGEFTLLSYSRDGESYVLNKWGHRRSDFPALNQFVEAMKETKINHAELLCELYAEEDGKPTKLPEFIHLIKGEDKDLSKIHIGIWDLIRIDGNHPPTDFRWKLQEVTSWIKDCSHVSVAPFIIPLTLKNVKDFWNTYVEGKGYEGIVIRQPTQTFKIKPTLEVDAVIIGLNKKTSYGKELDLFQQRQITSIKLALMTEDGNFIELSDCASGITANLRTSLWKLMEMKVAEDNRTVYITPVAVCTIQYTDTFIKRRQVLKFDGKQYREVARRKFVSLRHPRLLRFRADKDVTVQDLRVSQIPEDKLPKPDEEDKKATTSKRKPIMLSIPVGHNDNEYAQHNENAPRIVKPPIVLKPEDDFHGEFFSKLHAEGWGVNSSEYMRGDTQEEAIELQAKSFPCVEFQPVQLQDDKWVAFHRTLIREYLEARKEKGRVVPSVSEVLQRTHEEVVKNAVIKIDVAKDLKVDIPAKPQKEVICDKVGNYSNCIWTHRKECPEDLQKLCRKEELEWEKQRKAKYSIIIRPPAWKDHKYALFYSKEYSDSSGGETEFKTKQELLAFVRNLFNSSWRNYDSIVGRMPDKVTPKNLYFRSFTDEITKMELFGNRQLFDFSKNEQPTNEE